MAKATFWPITDADERKRGERTGLDTLVVHAVNDEYLVAEESTPSVPELIPNMAFKSHEFYVKVGFGSHFMMGLRPISLLVR